MTAASSMFPAATYTSRRSRLQSSFSNGLLLFLGNDEAPRNYADNTYHFRQDSSFLYYAGVNQGGWAMVIDVDEGTATAFANDLDIDAIVWTGPQPSVKELAARAGIDRTAPAAALGEVLAAAKAKGREIRFLPPYRADNALKLFRMLGVHPDEARSNASVDFIRAVVEQRAVKSAEEIAEIEKAVDTTVDMHVAAIAMAQPGMLESDIAARVTEVALAAGGDISFTVIATIHGETLHNHFHGNRLQPGRLFLLDCGAESATHYAGDLTSTFPVARTFTSRQKDVYDVVIGAQQAAVDALAPGVPFRDIHLLACRALAEGLKGLGLMKGDLDAAVAEGAHAMFMQSGLGHMMGLDVHDMEDLGELHVGYQGKPRSTQFGLKSLRLARPIEPGFVFTVEPGVYFIPELMDRWKAEGKFRDFIDYDTLETYRDFGGVRYEENYVAGGRTCRRLGKDRPKTTAEVEALR
jgi:Xaa-Pro aminopeptidase